MPKPLNFMADPEAAIMPPHPIAPCSVTTQNYP
jgi:hypothetical protein